MKTVNVTLPHHSYSIFIGSGQQFINDAYHALAQELRNKTILLVSDTNVAPLYAHQASEALHHVETAHVYSTTMNAGEPYKTLQTLEEFYHVASSCGLDRKSIVAALGGGVVGDTAGFLAATWMRGIRFLQLPTSLLAMVDSSVGGKVAVDLPEAKNIVGAFHQPFAVIADLNVLNTLPEREWKCGFAEIVKYAMILDADFFDYLSQHAEAIKNHQEEILEEIVAKCCELKAYVVSQDEKEQGLREILNYGHTFGHALETLSGYHVLNHGEGVAIGMMIAAELAALCNLIPRDIVKRQNDLLKQLDLHHIPSVVRELSCEQIIAVMRRDKKARQGNLRFVLPTQIGQCQTFDDITIDQTEQAIHNVLHA